MSEHPAGRHGVPKLEGLTFGEAVGVDNYKGALNGALAGADSLADKIVTAALAVGSAYGAVIALVAPKDSATPWQVVWPFVPLAGAVGLALWAQSRSVSIATEDEVDKVVATINSTISEKRKYGRWALYALIAALILAGVIVAKYYGPSAKTDSQPANVTVYLNAAGAKAVGVACGGTNQTSVTGTTTDASADPLVLKVDDKACANGGGTLVLPRRTVAATKQTP